jgi:hypothetical protein
MGSIEPSVLKIPKDIKTLDDEKGVLNNTIKNAEARLHEISQKLYDLKLWELHVTEIYRLAKLQFIRLRNNGSCHLTGADVAELEKWIGRVRNPEGLENIIEALKELNKYYPHEIRSNLYALVQKIIIEGPYKSRKRKGV